MPQGQTKWSLKQFSKGPHPTQTITCICFVFGLGFHAPTKHFQAFFFNHSSETHYVFLATLANINLKETILLSFSVSPVFNVPTSAGKHCIKNTILTDYLCLYCMVIYHEELALFNNAALSWLTSWPIRSKLSRKYFTDSLCKKRPQKDKCFTLYTEQQHFSLFPFIQSKKLNKIIK